jgi:hypothetical protein
LHQLGNLKLMETIAAAIRPAPMLDAIRKVAAAAAIAVPIAVGGAASPALARTGAPSAAVRAGDNIQVTVHLTVNALGDAAAAGSEITRTLEQEIPKIMARWKSKKDRREF